MITLILTTGNLNKPGNYRAIFIVVNELMNHIISIKPWNLFNF